MNEFITINKDIQTEFVEKKSRFISNIFYIDNVEKAEEYIKDIRKKYSDATHNCIAYRVIKENQVLEKSSDDGEPSGTAGVPILNILQKNNIINVLIIVTRYYGGIMLGAGGLVRAYSEGAKQVVSSTELVRKILGQVIEITIDYKEFEKFKYYCQNSNIHILSIEYLENIVCKIELEELQKQRLLIEIANKNINIVECIEIDKKYITICK